MKIERNSIEVLIEPSAYVRLKETGNIYQVMAYNSKSKGGYTKRIDKDNYIDTRTGEMKKVKHISNRSQDMQNVAKSLQKGRDLINTNVVYPTHCKWITGTYKENMKDTKKLQKDIEKFIEKLRKKYGKFEYIYCVEPQARGAWHFHLISIFDNIAPFMHNDDIANLWGHGFTKTKKLENVDNVGAYLTAYLADIDTSETDDISIYQNYKIEDKEIVEENGIITTKRIIKGARLAMYPAGTHIFRNSKGIKQPQISYTNYDRAKEIIGNAQKTYEKQITLSDEQSEYTNTLKYEYYNRNRKA